MQMVTRSSQRTSSTTSTDVNIPAGRLRNASANMSSADLAACRAALGSLQWSWLAVQTQPLLCGRCNILLSELIKCNKMSYPLEIQRVIAEVRKQPTVLKFFKIKTAKTWRDIHVVTLADQAYNNRPGGDSTGGLVTPLTGPEAKTVMEAQKKSHW